ncbi:hypothetical protein LSAT2_012501 [Lamellibrachia satsuma]|nr:hypothetical protein LSAT2_012501 [Lamellibrachia satsuma]
MSEGQGPPLPPPVPPPPSSAVPSTLPLHVPPPPSSHVPPPAAAAALPPLLPPVPPPGSSSVPSELWSHLPPPRPSAVPSPLWSPVLPPGSSAVPPPPPPLPVLPSVPAPPVLQSKAAAASEKARQPGSCHFVERDDRFSWTFHVGPAGGVLQVLTIVLSIPEGALTEDVAITIVVSTNKHDTPSLKDDQCLAGPIIHCLPHGLRFQKTVALSFGYNEHLAATQAEANLMVMCSETDVEETPAWTFDDSATTNFLVGDSRRCLVFLDHFCTFTVVNVKTGDELLAKGVVAMVCAEYLAAARTIIFRVCCVDDETTATQLFKYRCSKPGLGTLAAREPFIMYNNGKDVDVSLSQVRRGWTAEGDHTKRMSFLKVWHAMQPSHTFQLSRGLREETEDGQQDMVSCVIITGQRDSSECDVATTLIIGHLSKFENPLKYDMERNSIKYESVIPHQLKMELVTLLDPTDHVHGRDWRLLASELGLDEKVRYLETKSNPTELLLAVWETKSCKLTTLISVLRSTGRDDAAAAVENHIKPHNETTSPRGAASSDTPPSGGDAASTDNLIPEKLKSELAVLLDPIDVVSGHDWRHLASQLKLDEKIRYLQIKGDPTHRLLSVCETRKISMPELVAMMRTMEREDAAKAIEAYVNPAHDPDEVSLLAGGAAVYRGHGGCDNKGRENEHEIGIDGCTGESNDAAVTDTLNPRSSPETTTRKAFLS